MAKKQGEVLRKQHWLQTHRSCHHHLVTHPVPELRHTWGGSVGCHPPTMQRGEVISPPCTYLVLAAGGQQLSLPQPGDDGLGVPECHAGQGDAAAFLRLHVLRRRLREGGGSWGAEGDPVTPPRSHVLSPSQWHSDGVEVATRKLGTPPEPPPPQKGALKCCPCSLSPVCNVTGAVPSVPYSPEVRGRAKNPWRAPRGASPYRTLLPSGSLCDFPPRFPPHINLLLSKHKKTPQCRSKGSFLIKEAGRITARP